jgi:hypothetical protein
MGKRLTRIKDKYECRIDHCPLEEWVMEQIPECTGLSCDGCPVMKHMNKLAEYEDKCQPVDDGTEVYLLTMYYDCEYNYKKCPLGMVEGYKCEVNEYCSHEYLQCSIKTIPFEAEKHAAQWGVTVFATEEEAKAEYKKIKKEGK